MNPPPKLFENGPEWCGYKDYWACNLVRGQDFVAVLFTTPDPNIFRPELDCETGDRMTLDEALTWLRARIIAHRDELVRVTG